MEARGVQRGAPVNRPGKLLCGYTIFVAGATLLLIFAGGLVTSTGSGLAVPDWPLSFGRFFPPMEGGVLFEHGHRMVAAFVGLLTLVLAVWISIRETRPGIRWLAAAALVCVVLQVVLGGVTVLLRLPLIVSVAHACLGQVFFCILIALSVLMRVPPAGALPGDSPPPRRALLAGLATATTGVVFLQLILGALMRHLGAGLAIPDFPLAFGRILPHLSSSEVTVHFLHRVGAVLVTVFFSATAGTACLRRGPKRGLLYPAVLGFVLLGCQLVLGAFVIWTGMGVWPTTAHVAVGAGVLGCSLVLAIRSFQIRSFPAAEALPAAASGEALGGVEWRVS